MNKHKCDECGGEGYFHIPAEYNPEDVDTDCPTCQGSGFLELVVGERCEFYDEKGAIIAGMTSCGEKVAVNCLCHGFNCIIWRALTEGEINELLRCWQSNRAELIQLINKGVIIEYRGNPVSIRAWTHYE
jgi:hypothetical protein